MSEGRFVIVSEWMAKGNINEFVKVNLSADRLELVRLLFVIITLVCY